MSQIQILDYWTQYALNAIWKEWVQECINDIETGITFDNYYNYHTGSTSVTTFNNNQHDDYTLTSIIVNN